MPCFVRKVHDALSVIVSFRINEKLKRKMEEFSYINWSEVVRRAIAEVIAKEETKRSKKDINRIKRAVLKSEGLSRRVEGWSSVEEIRRWRERA